jgi:hypothetical protein
MFVQHILFHTLEKKDSIDVIFFLGWEVGMEWGWSGILCVWSMELKKKKKAKIII